ncbi:TIGR02588 family protein [Trichormus variabilis]|uniref:TIGR02588 family protein n=1 Tax=Trichormus variabilis SAG 1403-4b TaxID=447716 RepID=A0A3S1CVH1_ANAVA|nr:TIGR02588 family protein [Trichormus variabilis]MBD2625717.1 TIGR02588 family protein [Trichormus variabilis FACHB-164]RUS99000.1 TIGR02588 family protein [Trichormus variabilis SAG 1403-4b]
MIETEPERSLAEWITFGIALSILAVVISLVGYMWLNEKNLPPILSVQRQQMIREIDGKFYVPFEIVNTGGETAESVQIIAELQIADKVVETGEQQIDFLSDGEKEEGAFIFSQNPRHGQLTVRVASYKLP